MNTEERDAAVWENQPRRTRENPTLVLFGWDLAEGGADRAVVVEFSTEDGYVLVKREITDPDEVRAVMEALGAPAVITQRPASPPLQRLAGAALAALRGMSA